MSLTAGLNSPYATANGVLIVNLAADPASPSLGQIYYNTTSNVYRYYTNTGWQQLLNTWTTLEGAPHITVTPQGPTDGGNFGPNTPDTTTGGMAEALAYLEANGGGKVLRKTGTYTHTAGLVILRTAPPMEWEDEPGVVCTFSNSGTFLQIQSNSIILKNVSPIGVASAIAFDLEGVFDSYYLNLQPTGFTTDVQLYGNNIVVAFNNLFESCVFADPFLVGTNGTFSANSNTWVSCRFNNLVTVGTTSGDAPTNNSFLGCVFGISGSTPALINNGNGTTVYNCDCEQGSGQTFQNGTTGHSSLALARLIINGGYISGGSAVNDPWGLGLNIVTGSGRVEIMNCRGTSGATNVIGAVNVSVSSSPFVYTNNDGVPEAIYIIDGTVTNITKNGINIFDETDVTLYLQPGEQITVTFAIAPTFIKDLK